MFFVGSLRAHPAFRIGLREMSPQAPGIAAWGLMTGVAMVKSGLSITESSLMALLVFAGSSQLSAMPLLIAGAPAWVILATGFCVNLRFVVFSLHLRPYLIHLPLWRRLTHGYLTADITYVLFTSPLSGSGHRCRGAPRGGGVPGRQLLRELGQLGRRQPGGHRAGQPDSRPTGAWDSRASCAWSGSCARSRARACAWSPARWRAWPRWPPMHCRSS
jgi:hypothetical protein